MASGCRTVIELSSSFLKAVRSRFSSGKAVLLWSAVVPVSGLQDKDIAALLRKWRAARCLALPGDEVVWLVPRALAMIKELTLPSHEHDELARMLELHLAGQTPYARGELASDYILQERLASGYSRVLAVMVPSLQLERYRALFSDAGFSSVQVSLSSAGFARSAGFLSAEKDACLLDIYSDGFEICFTVKGELAYSRQLPLEKEGAERFSQLSRLYAQTLAACKKEGGALSSVADIYCFCSRKDFEAFFSADIFRGAALHYAGFPEKKFLSSRFSWPEEVLSGEVSLSAACGAALSAGRLAVNLISTQERARQTRGAARQLLWRALATAFLGAAALAGVMSIPWFRQRVQLQQLERELLDLKPEVERVREKARQVQSLEKLAYGALRVPAGLREVWDLVGRDIVLTVLDFSSTGGVSMEGYSSAQEAVNRLYERLGLSPLLADVRIEYINKRVLERGEVDYFRISCRMKEEL